MIRQLSVFIENKQGALADAAEVLAKENINIRAMTLADTTKYGVLRMIVDKADAAGNALTRAGYLTRA
ncbi:MAG: ACT domain-containing protein, partial [Clostridia bacterium]|nr:ACT domain-containing protein [Clostridia bacterium]